MVHNRYLVALCQSNSRNDGEDDALRQTPANASVQHRLLWRRRSATCAQRPGHVRRCLRNEPPSEGPFRLHVLVCGCYGRAGKRNSFRIGEDRHKCFRCATRLRLASGRRELECFCCVHRSTVAAQPLVYYGGKCPNVCCKACSSCPCLRRVLEGGNIRPAGKRIPDCKSLRFHRRRARNVSWKRKTLPCKV